MNGPDLSKWIEDSDFSRSELMLQLGLKSRQTLYAKEHSKENLPRLWELALMALEKLPAARQEMPEGKQATKTWNDKHLPTREEEEKFSKEVGYSK